ncbi:MAG: S8 family serine peptidase [Muribaculaceae bacterium]|nr:S8 family serine peptidase [Muribaculaceae bacterium]
MKKILLLAFAAAAVPIGAHAQSKLDAPAVRLLQMATTEVSSRSGDFRTLQSDFSESQKHTFFVRVDHPDNVSLLTDAGYEVLSSRDEIAIVLLSPEELATISGLDYVKSISAGYEAKPLLAEARKETGVASVQAGTGLDQAYDGSGVVCGIMDTGLDPNHINFDGRINRMWVITGTNSAVAEYSGASISSFTTDNSKQTHGTHVLGIIGGAYKGNGEVAKYNERTGRLQISKNSAIPYYGVATGVELAPCAGTLQGSNIQNAAEKILAYAKSQGKPAVLNLSLGHNYGPHDGTTDANKYLASLGKEMLICISAGNEGGSNISYSKTLTSSDKSIKTCVSASSAADGVVDFWSSDATPFSVKFMAINKTNGNVEYSYELPATSRQQVYITGSYYNAQGYIRPAEFDKFFGERAAVVLTPTLNAGNNRYNVYVSVQTSNGSNSNIVPAFEVVGESGKTIHIYGDLVLRSNDLSGYINGNDSETINDMACGENVISVGAYVNQAIFPTLNGERQFNGATKGAIAPFSSYGQLPDGTKLPIIAGPGMGMISSYSYHYMNATGDTEYSTAIQQQDKRTNYWKEMSGTSMSSPFVAGVMALWLQADPTLTIGEVKDVLRATARQDEFTAAAPHRFGYGKIDALEGIKYIKNLGAVNDVKVDNEILVSEVGAGSFDVFAPGASEVSAQLFSLGGAAAASASAAGENVTLSADGLSAGVYILRATAGANTVTRKVVVR